MENYTYHNPAISLSARAYGLKIYLTEGVGVTISHTFGGVDYQQNEEDVPCSIIHITHEDIDKVIKTLKKMKIQLQLQKEQVLEELLEAQMQQRNARSH